MKVWVGYERGYYDMFSVVVFDSEEKAEEWRRKQGEDREIHEREMNSDDND